MIETNFSCVHEQEKLHHRYVTQKICKQKYSLRLEQLERASCLCASSHSRPIRVICVHKKEALEEACRASLQCLSGMERGGGVFISIYSIDECNWHIAFSFVTTS